MAVLNWKLVAWKTSQANDMVRLNTLLVTLLIAVLGIALPTVLVFWFAQKQGAEAEQRRAEAFAGDVLEKSERTFSEFIAVAERLSPLLVGDPCGTENLNLMEYSSLSSTNIKALGFVRDNLLLCSSLNIPGRTFDMGDADYRIPLTPPLEIRTDVFIPRIGELEFMVLERAGLSALIQEASAIDVVTESDDIVLALIGAADRHLLFENGPLEPAWLDILPGAGESASSIVGNYIVAIARSADLDIAAVSAIPITYLDARSHELLGYLVPVGLAAGAALIWAIVFLSRHQLEMPQAIRSGLRRKEFHLVYQPIIELDSGRWVGAEALMRWKRPNGEIISPEVFMVAAEECGLMSALTERLFQLVAQDAPKLLAASEDFHITLNLSAEDIHDPGVVARMETLKAECGAGPGQLYAEITERGLTRPERAIDVIHRLREMGIPVAVDDFGTGYSSLSYLESFDLDYLKIDKFFVDSIEGEEGSVTGTVLLHIIEMAKSLKLGIIAEGVETEGQRSVLARYGVQYVQGWLFSKPLKCAVLARKLRKQQPLERAA